MTRLTPTFAACAAANRATSVNPNIAELLAVRL